MEFLMTEEQLNHVFDNESLEALGMKKNIPEIFPERVPKSNAGRPPKHGKAMTNAERQKARRERVKAMKQDPAYQREQEENRRVEQAKEEIIRSLSSFFGEFRAMEENLLKSDLVDAPEHVKIEHNSEVSVFDDIADMLMKNFGKNGLEILMRYPEFAISFKKHSQQKSE